MKKISTREHFFDETKKYLQLFMYKNKAKLVE